MEKENQKYKQVRQIVQRKIGFIRHFIVYIIVMIVLAIINNVTSSGYQWWLWIALWWGIGVIINFLIAFVFKGGGLKKLEKELIRKEMERMKDED